MSVLRAACSRALSGLLGVLLAASGARASPEAAHEHYQRAIELVRNDDLREARREFERAFAESPHPAVLYNLARVCLALGERDDARRYAEQFLAKAGPEAREDQRRDMQRLLEEIGGSAARGDTAVTIAASPPEASSNAPLPPIPRPASTPVSTVCPGCLSPERVDSRVAAERGRTAGIVLGATGTALLATGVGILLWNGGQARAADRQQEALAGKQPSRDVADQGGLLEVLAYERAVSENQAEFRSVERFDVVGWSAVGVGAALLGTGVVLILTHPGEPEATLSLRGQGLALSTRF